MTNALAIPLRAEKSKMRGMIVFYADDSCYFNDIGIASFQGLAHICEVIWKQSHLTFLLTQHARLDRLTGLLNRQRIARAFERNAADKAQRIVVVGSGNFLANTYLGLLGNRDLGLNIANWLAEDDALIMIQPRATVDAELSLSKNKLLAIVIGSLVLLPLLLLANALRVWWRRRSA